jgi:hypothetical protein
MKKLYFLNEDESSRILNLHKDATKKQYISETLSLTQAQIDAANAAKASSNKVPSSPIDYLSGDKTKNTNQNPFFSKVNTSTTPTTVKSTGYVNKPLVTKIQQSLKEKGVNLGTSGPNKDGIDGVLGNLTLNGIISVLGGGKQPETMVSKEVKTVQEPNTTPDLKTTTTSTETSVASTQPTKSPEATAADL